MSNIDETRFNNTHILLKVEMEGYHGDIPIIYKRGSYQSLLDCYRGYLKIRTNTIYEGEGWGILTPDGDVLSVVAMLYRVEQSQLKKIENGLSISSDVAEQLLSMKLIDDEGLITEVARAIYLKGTTLT